MKCPECGGQVIHDGTHRQLQEDIIRRTIVRRFDVAVGHFVDSVAMSRPSLLANFRRFGSGPGQVGPVALTLAAHLTKQTGPSHERTAQVLAWGYGLEVSRSALCLSMGEPI